MRILELQTEQGNRIAFGTVKRLVGERNHRSVQVSDRAQAVIAGNLKQGGDPGKTG